MKNRPSVLALSLAAFLWAASPAAAPLPKPEEVVALRVEPLRVNTRAGAAVDVTLFASIKKGFHLNSDKPTLEYLVPTRVEVLNPSVLRLEKAEYPDGELKSFGFAPDEMLSVYEGLVRVPVTLRMKFSAPVGVHEVRLALHYQACNDRLCLRPAQRTVQVSVQVE